MAFERRLEAVVVGPGKPGQVRVALGRGQHQFVADVPFELLQPSLRMPNSEFVAVVKDRDLVRIEPAGRLWLTIQDQIRAVLNGDWDPIGVADIVDYDMTCISGAFTRFSRKMLLNKPSATTCCGSSLSGW